MASSLSDEAQFVTFALGKEVFAVPVGVVREILDYEEVFRIPNGPDYLLGLRDVRGQGVPTIDLRLKLGLSRTEPTPSTRVLVLDVEPGQGQARAASRGQPSDRYERLDGAFHARVRAGFLAIAGAEPERCVVVAASGTVAEVAQRIRRIVADRLRIGLGAP